MSIASTHSTPQIMHQNLAVPGTSRYGKKVLLNSSCVPGGDIVDDRCVGAVELGQIFPDSRSRC